MITYEVEEFQKAAPLIARFWHDHMMEVGADLGKFELSPDFERYCQMQDRGQLMVMVVRKYGQAIGYYAATIVRHLHYDSLTAYTDVFYITPEYRKGMVGVRLFKEAEQALKERGVERIYTAVKLKIDVGPILERMGYNPIERVYTKVVKE